MKIRNILVIPAALLVFACGGSNPEPEVPTAESVEKNATPPVEEPKVEAPKTEQPAEEKKEELVALNKPKSKWTVGGKSVSEAQGDDIVAAFKKAGWVKDGVAFGNNVAGQYESGSLEIEKGKVKGTVTIVRPAATPVASSSPVSAPSTLSERANKDTSAFTYDEEGDVYVQVEITEGGKAADAKKILDAVFKKAK